MSTTQKGMLVDSSICIGCKACQVACKEWNQLPMEDEAAVHLGNAFLAESYDNTGHLSSTNWRHVKFIEQFDGGQTGRDTARWLMMSDSCKHCVQAGCLEVCPTASITFGNLDDLKSLAASRIQALHRRGQTDAYVYGWDLKAEGYDRPSSGAQDVKVVGGLNVFYLLLDKPHVYGLPDHDPGLPQKNILPNAGGALVMAGVLGIAGVAAFRKRRMDAAAAAPE